MPDPGQYDGNLKAFASDLKKVDFGRKYEFKVDSNPRVGQYDTDNKAIKPSSKSAQIREPTSTYKRPQENSPDPGSYDGHLQSFGSTAKSF